MTLADAVVVRVRSDGEHGLFASRMFRRGDVLLTYDGPIIGRPTRLSIQIDEDRHVEGTTDSNAYLNHSCAPNAYVDWDQLALRALREIAADEEITCNYLTTDWELHAPFVCRCGAPGCFGEIRGFRFLSPDLQRRLGPYAPAFMRRRIAPAAAEDENEHGTRSSSR